MSLRTLSALLALFLVLPSGALGAQSITGRTEINTDRISKGITPGFRRPVPLYCGGVRPGEITAPGRSRTYFFSGSIGEVVDLALVASPGSFTSSLLRATVVAPSGLELGTLYGTTLATVILTEAGKHKVTVTAGETGVFHIGRGCPPPRVAGTALACGQLTPGDLVQPGQLEYFTFDALAGDDVQISLVATAGFAPSVPRGTLFDPSGLALGTFDADNLTSFTLGQTGTYTIRVQANDLVGTGAFGVGLFCSPPLGTPTILGCGPQVQKSIATPGSVEYFTFDGVIDDMIEISLVATGGFALGAPQVQVFSPSGVSLGAFSGNSLTPLTLAETGTYTARVTASTLAETGSFSIGLACRPPLGAATPIACGGSVTSPISVLGEVDYYTFTGNTGETADIMLTAVMGFASSTPQMRVFSPSGVDLGAFNADSTTSIPVALQETGTFALRVTANNLADTGTYQVALTCLPPPFAAVHLGAGSLSAGSIDLPAETDCFTFDGQVNDVIELTLVQRTGPAVPRGTLFSPLGTNLGTFDGNSLNEFTLSSAGRHTVKVTASNLLSTGAYSLGLGRRDPLEPPAPPLVCGALLKDGFTAAGEVDYFTFDGTVGDVVELTLVQTAGPAVARGKLFSPTDVDLGAFQANSLTEFTLAETGTYKVRVFATNLISLGSYNIGLECRVPLGPVEAHLTCGDLVSNGFTQSGEVDYFTLVGTAGDVVELTLVTTVGPALARGRLFSPSDVDLGFFDANSLNEFTLAETGVYKIRVAATNLVSGGSYNLGLECRNPLGPIEEHLECGDLASNGFTQSGEVDYFTFDGSLGDVVELTLVQTAGPAVARGKLFSPTDVDLGAFQANSLTEFTLAETGTYRVRVFATNLISLGSYNIGLECRNPLGPVEAHLTCGDLVSNGFTQSGEVDYFTFDGTVNDVVELTLVTTVGPALARGRLFSPTDADLGAFTANSLTEFTLAETGTYKVRVFATNLVSGGSYNLGLECRNPLGPVEAHLECGDLASNGFTQSGEVDYFTFDGSLGDVVELTLVQTAGPAVPRGRLFSPTDADLGAFTANSLTEFTLAETGLYRVRVFATNLVSGGSYNFGLECRSPLGPVEAHLTCGDLVSNGFTQSGEVDYFTFDGTVNDVVELTLVTTVGPALARGRLFSPTDADLGAFTANSLTEFTLAETGTYKVRVFATNLVSGGSYNLGLECRNPLGPVEAHLTCGSVVSNGFTQSGEVDYFTFDGTLNDIVDLTLTQTVGPGVPRGRLFSPTGVDLGAWNANSTKNVVLPETGTYVIRVRATNLVSGGSYNLGLSCL